MRLLINCITHRPITAYLTQPTVSHYIPELEKELGCKLFTRFKKGVRLTPKGSILYGHIAKAYAKIDRGEADLKAYLELGQSVIKIGTSETTLRDYLMPCCLQRGC